MTARELLNQLLTLTEEQQDLEVYVYHNYENIDICGTDLFEIDEIDVLTDRIDINTKEL